MANGKLTDFDVATTIEATDKMYLVRDGEDLQSSLATVFANIPGPMKTAYPLYLGGTPQTLAEGGVITVTQTTTYISNTGDVGLTINDGLFDGQVKVVLMDSATSISTLTGANVVASSIEFDAAGKTLILMWQQTQWWALSGTATINH